MSDEKKSPEDYTYDFFGGFQDDQGILADKNDPFGSYGDTDAIEDLNADRQTAPLQFMLAEDGLPAPAPSFDGMAVLEADTTVGLEEMVCLAGPCKHYTECVIEGAHGLNITQRFCDRVCTWAEPLRLEDVNVMFCSGHDPEDKEGIKRRIVKNAVDVAKANRKAEGITEKSLGICSEANCGHYVVMAVGRIGPVGEIEPQVERYCSRLAGAARLRKMDPYHPVLGCSAVKPGAPLAAKAISDGMLEIERRKFDPNTGDEGHDRCKGRQDDCRCKGEAGPCTEASIEAE